jgi:superfamily II DNA or RNA helicase
MINYQNFIKKKEFNPIMSGFDPDLSWNSYLKDFQLDIVRWAVNRGRAAIFADTGLGKTLMQLSWAFCVTMKIGKPVLVLAPLAVSDQTIEEGKKFGIHVEKLKSDVFGPGIYIINYEQLKNVDVSQFGGVVLDESSILKGLDGRLRKMITDSFRHTPYKLSCTATPSPNDLMEFGTQSEFLGVMSLVEMLAMFFIHDGENTSKWRLKGHGRRKFWEWLSTWAVFIRKPSDYGYDATGYDLPPLNIIDHVVESGITDGLLPWIAQSLSERGEARKKTVDQRVSVAAEIANSVDGQCLIWCNLNDESQKLASSIDDAYEVFGSQKPEEKSKLLLGFSHGDVSRLVTKPKIAGFGMNWQGCNNMVFTGLSDSFEQYYQAVRRCWRFGQTKQVNVHIVSADSEGAVTANIKRKEQLHEEVSNEMIKAVGEFTAKQLGRSCQNKTEYKPTKKMEIPSWM